ncbi:MAG: cysteine--tRNA ligase [Planctomycetota bacterium]|nr:cysteine--tRNA ligase [Planctomycetota bacterium]
MSFHLHDTLQRKKVPFEPLLPGKVTMYNCGPTVYSPAHIGNFRSFLFADVLRRWLEVSGYEVTQVMNITDVGHLRDDDPETGADKMEEASRKEKLDPWQIAEKYTALFMEDLDKLGMLRAVAYPRATDHIPQMIAQIEGLLESGHAYEAGGAVYYAVSSFPDYGRLSGNVGEDLIAGARVKVADEKRDPRDFALWKSDPHHLMQWDSPFGRGFPGWHIECSAMSQSLLGETLDIHTGGEDNIFPHHECEIAQAEGATGKPFVRYWMHARHLMLDGGKMSKSLGNLYTIGQLEEMGHPPIAVRFALLRSQYRQVLNFTLDGLKEAASSVRRLRLFAEEMELAAGDAKPADAPSWITAAVKRFDESMDDDLNTSGALDGVFTLLHEAHRRQATGADAASALAALRRFDRVLGVLHTPTDDHGLSEAADEEIEDLIRRRTEAREAKDWAAADVLRDRLAALGIELLDGKEGKVRWRRTGTQSPPPR